LPRGAYPAPVLYSAFHNPQLTPFAVDGASMVCYYNAV
jgi:hypothetical protein